MLCVGDKFPTTPDYEGDLCVSRQFRNFVVLSASEGPCLIFRLIATEEKSKVACKGDKVGFTLSEVFFSYAPGNAKIPVTAG
jgi:hypothetical protein